MVDDDRAGRSYAVDMDYARQRAYEVLKPAQQAVLVTSGPAGLQASECPCVSSELDLYLLVPETSDHLYNLEYEPGVILLNQYWKVKGSAQMAATGTDLDLVHGPKADWCVLVWVKVQEIQVRREDGWGYCETIEI